MTERPSAVALVQATLALNQGSLEAIVATHILSDTERGAILLALSDHIVACEVIASTLRDVLRRSRRA